MLVRPALLLSNNTIAAIPLSFADFFFQFHRRVHGSWKIPRPSGLPVESWDTSFKIVVGRLERHSPFAISCRCPEHLWLFPLVKSNIFTGWRTHCFLYNGPVNRVLCVAGAVISWKANRYNRAGLMCIRMCVYSTCGRYTSNITCARCETTRISGHYFRIHSCPV